MILALLFNLFVLTPSFADSSPELIVLSKGDLKSLPASGGRALKVSNGRVLKVKDQGRSITVYAQKEGESLLYIGEKAYRFSVVRPGLREFYLEVSEGLKARMGLKAELSEGQILIEGQLLRWSDWEWLSITAKKHQASFRLNASIDPEVHREALPVLTAALKAQSLAPVHIEWGPPLLATLSSSFKSQIKTYQNALSSFGIAVEVREQQLALLPSVQVEVVMAELTQRVDREFGLEWSPFGDFQVLPHANFQSSLGATLKALESRGLGKVLATPRILCRSGSEAEFHSGGEVPIPVTEFQSHYKTQNIIWKKHGILLKFKPQADLHGRMSLKIYAELSVLADQQAAGVPAVLINKIESEFDLARPQTVALSGLIRQDWHRGKRGLPWVSQIPVLGPLFSSENFMNRRSELVIFVTPKIVDSAEAPTTMPRGWADESL